MKHFKVCINYGHQMPAFETTVQAVNQKMMQSIKSKVLGILCVVFDAAIKNNSTGVLIVANSDSFSCFGYFNRGSC